MRNKGLKLKCVFVLVLGWIGLQAQTSVHTLGSNATGSGGSVSYSVGQVVYSTHKGSTGSVSEGVQLPFEILLLTGIEQTGIDLQCVAYPNPATDVLHLCVSADFQSKTIYKLYDEKGQMLQSALIKSPVITVKLNEYSKAVFFIKIVDLQGKELKSFKIIKN